MSKQETERERQERENRRRREAFLKLAAAETAAHAAIVTALRLAETDRHAACATLKGAETVLSQAVYECNSFVTMQNTAGRGGALVSALGAPRASLGDESSSLDQWRWRS